MRSLRWFLIGVICTMILSDWIRLKSEHDTWMPMAQKAMAQAVRNHDLADTCLANLEDVRRDIDNETSKRQLVRLAEVRTEDLVRQAAKGNKEAKSQVAELQAMLSSYDLIKGGVPNGDAAPEGRGVGVGREEARGQDSGSSR